MDEVRLTDLRDKVTEIELIGGTYRLCFDFNALCLLEEREQELDADENTFSFRRLRLKLWAGLQAHHPEIDTVEAAGKLIPAHDFLRVAAQVGQALMDNMPTQGKVEEGPAAPTGPSSSTSAAGTSARSSSGGAPHAS